jgi:hypothetical protein
MYISWPCILELGLKPDLVYNPSVIASKAFSLHPLTLLSLLLLVLFLYVALRIR